MCIRDRVYSATAADATPRAPFKWKMIADGCTAAVALYTIYQGTATRLTGDPLAGFNSRIYGELAFPMLYVLWLFALTQAPTSLSYRVFTWTPFRRLGDYSFALYCLHFPVLHYYAWARYGGEYWGHKNRGGSDGGAISAPQRGRQHRAHARPGDGDRDAGGE